MKANPDRPKIRHEADDTGSIGSLGSIGSIYSLGSIGSICSIGSIGSICSIGSIGSICSIGSIGSMGSTGSIGGMGIAGAKESSPKGAIASIFALFLLATMLEILRPGPRSNDSS